MISDNHNFRKDPIIVTGAGHSGTRGLVSVLSCSKELYLGDISNDKREWEFYRILAAEVNSILLSIPKQHNHNIISTEYYYQQFYSEHKKEEAIEYARNKIANYHSDSMPPNDEILWLLKTPRTTICLDIWYSIFPKAKFINLIRDGRDVANSLPKDAGSLIRRFELWRSRVNAVERFRNQGIEIHDIRYEDLNNRSEIEKLCEFVGIQYTTEMLELFKASYGKGVKAFARIKEFEKIELLKYGYIAQ